MTKTGRGETLAEEPYDPDLARRILNVAIAGKPQPKEQMQALVDLPTEDFRQVLLHILRGKG